MRRGGSLTVLLALLALQVPLFRCLSDCRTTLAPLWRLADHHCHDEAGGPAADHHCVGHRHGCGAEREHGERHAPGHHAVLLSVAPRVAAAAARHAGPPALLAIGPPVASAWGHAAARGIPAPIAQAPPPARPSALETIRLLL
jgi:hypothetical protein